MESLPTSGKLRATPAGSGRDSGFPSHVRLIHDHAEPDGDSPSNTEAGPAQRTHMIESPRSPVLNISLLLDSSTRSATISVAGELDPSTADRLRDVCVLAQRQATDVLIDLSDVTYCGAAGLAALCEAEEAGRDAPGSCRFDRPSHPVRMAIGACGLAPRLAAS